MSRRRRSSEVVLVDLGVPGAGEGPPSGAGRPLGESPPSGAGWSPGEQAASDEGATPPQTGARSHRTPAQARRQALAAGAVLVVGLGAWGATTAVHEHQRQARLAAAPGGVLSLAEPPAELWTADTDGAWDWQFLPGIVVVRDGAEIVGLDAAGGAERWRIEVGGDPVCGPNRWRRTPPVADRIACWSGPNADRSYVTVVDRDGLVATRDLDPGLALVQPGPDGTLVTVRRTGPQAPPPDVEVTGDESAWEVTGSIPAGQDAIVRLEDAATGEVAWERTVPFEPVADVNTCATWTFRDGSDTPEIVTDQVSLTTETGLVQLSGCGLRAAFAADGTPASDPSTSAWSDAEPYLDGGVLERVGGYAQDSAVATVLHRPDGGVETFDGDLLVPWATDGVPSDVRLVGGYQRQMRALTPDGTELWRTDGYVTDVLVRANGMLLVARSNGAAQGLDLTTGESLWTDETLLRGHASTTDWWGADAVVRAAGTDGERAFLAVAPLERDADGFLRLVAVDLATGEVTWQEERPDRRAQLVTAGGRLYLVDPTDPDGGVELRDEGGQIVRHADGTLTALG